MVRDLIEILNKTDMEEVKRDELTEQEVVKKPFSYQQVPVGIMAYVGDSFFDLIVRNFFIRQGLWDSHRLHRKVTRYVNAGAQATLFRQLEEELTEEEKGVFRRGRNSNAGNVPKNANVTDYRHSTGFEAVLGYLILKGDLARVEIIVRLIEKYLGENTLGS